MTRIIHNSGSKGSARPTTHCSILTQCAVYLCQVIDKHSLPGFGAILLVILDPLLIQSIEEKQSLVQQPKPTSLFKY